MKARAPEPMQRLGMVLEAWVCEVEAGDSEGHWSANLAMLASSSLRDRDSKNKDGEP